MISAEALPRSVAVATDVSPLFRTSRGALLLLFGVIYAGCLEFFITFSPVLLYGTYVAILACLSVCCVFDWSITREARSVVPYLVWTLGYFIWAMIAISSESIATTEGLKMYIKNFLLIGSLAIALDRRNLKTFAQLVQIAALANFGLAVWETWNPSLVEAIAQRREEGATAFDVLRPAGLWSNPDEAASSFIFALLLARWAGRPLAMAGRIAAVIGIYLTASRAGTYMLVFCGLVYAGYWLKTHRIDSARIAALIATLMLGGAAIFGLAMHFGFDPSEHWKLARMLDFSEATTASSGGSRLDIARKAVETAIDGPWCGYGLFTFQYHAQGTIPTILDPPAHNIYLTIWGEAGLLVAVTYVVLMGAGAWRAFRFPMLPGDRIAISLMWCCYLFIGVTWHNQFTAFSGMLFSALLWHLPSILRLSLESSWDRPEGAVG